MIEKNIDHLNLDLDSDGELERYNLQDKRVDDLEALKNLDYVLSSGVEAPTNFKEVIVGNYDYTELDGLRINSSANSTCKALIKKLCAQYTNKENVLFKGGITKDYDGYFEIYIDNTNDLDSNGLPKYSTGLYRYGSTAFYKCWTIDYAYSVANVTVDSVATQTQKGLMSAEDKVKLDNSSIVEITWENFQALSEAEQNNGTTYYIKDLPPRTLNAEMIKYDDSDVKSALDKNKSDISTLNRFIDTRNLNPSSTNIIIFPDVPDLRIKCTFGYVSGVIYGFMQNVGAFAVNIYGNGGNIGISDLQGNIVSLGLISVNRRTQDVGNELSINASNHFNGIFIGVSI